VTLVIALLLSNSLEIQRASVERQRAAALTAMAAAVERQRASVRQQGATPVTAGAEQVDCAPMRGPGIDRLISEMSEREGLTPDLLRAVIRKESSFQPCAVSPKGAMGLMQLMPATAEQFRVRDPFDPRENLSAGAKFLKQLLGRYGNDLALALGAYNAGPANVDLYGGVPPFQETVGYVSEILRTLGVPGEGNTSLSVTQ
jgi:soluble lytic murein transglycosylase-like protein